VDEGEEDSATKRARMTDTSTMLQDVAPAAALSV
jgi:hypothetical protein